MVLQQIRKELEPLCECGKVAQFRDTYISGAVVYRCWPCHRRNIKPGEMTTFIIDEKLRKRIEDNAIPAPPCPRVCFPNSWIFPWRNR